MKYKMKWFLSALFLCLVLANCTKFDEYKKYVSDGEIVYLQKADSLKTYPGRNRILLEWLLIDPKVTLCKVFYQQGAIQEEVDVNIPTFGSRENDTIRVMISDLDEGIYSFKIVSYDNLGNTSIPVEVEEQVYGETYAQSQLNRLVKSTEFNFEKSILTLKWSTADASITGVELNYINIDNVLQTLFVDPSEETTIVPDFKLGEPLFYSTMYKPVPTSIDTFLVEQERIYIELTDNVALKKPVISSGSATPAYTEVNAVDGDRTSAASRWIARPFDSSPQWIEIDLQGYFEISGLGMWRDGGGIAGSQKFSLQAWIENEWIDIFTENNNVTTVYHREFDSIITNKVRLYLHPTVSTDYMIRLFEIEVYAVTRY